MWYLYIGAAKNSIQVLLSTYLSYFSFHISGNKMSYKGQHLFRKRKFGILWSNFLSLHKTRLFYNSGKSSFSINFPYIQKQTSSKQTKNILVSYHKSMRPSAIVHVPDSPWWLAMLYFHFNTPLYSSRRNRHQTCGDICYSLKTSMAKEMNSS